MLLDWEYAHVSDGFWDLAGWVSNNDWGPGEAEQLLAGYLQRPVGRADLERLAAWAWLYDYVCLLWSELYLIRRPGAYRAEIAERAEVLATRLARAAAEYGGPRRA
jgi:thiamine kinase-like enzyme